MARAREELIRICYKDFHLLRTGFRCPSSHIYEEILIPRILETFDGFGKEGSCFFHPPPFQFIFFKPCCDSGVQVPRITCLPQPLTFDIKCTWSGAGSLLQTLFIWMGLAAGRLQKKCMNSDSCFLSSKQIYCTVSAGCFEKSWLWSWREIII